ncbi:unnamed protein product [Musa hybrid cultivar]
MVTKSKIINSCSKERGQSLSGSAFLASSFLLLQLTNPKDREVQNHPRTPKNFEVFSLDRPLILSLLSFYFIFMLKICVVKDGILIKVWDMFRGMLRDSSLASVAREQGPSSGNTQTHFFLVIGNI